MKTFTWPIQESAFPWRYERKKAANSSVEYKARDGGSGLLAFAINDSISQHARTQGGIAHHQQQQQAQY